VCFVAGQRETPGGKHRASLELRFAGLFWRLNHLVEIGTSSVFFCKETTIASH
jgi:hypothetical protein